MHTVNSVPANSAVDKNSSKELCSVTDCKLSLPQSYPSAKSDVCSYSKTEQLFQTNIQQKH